MKFNFRSTPKFEAEVRKFVCRDEKADIVKKHGDLENTDLNFYLGKPKFHNLLATTFSLMLIS